MKTPKFPRIDTLTGRALMPLLTGRRIVHKDFQTETGSYRLAEFIRQLRHRHGWPIQTEELTAPAGDSATGRAASYGRYFIDPLQLVELRAQLGERLTGFIESVQRFEDGKQ